MSLLALVGSACASTGQPTPAACVQPLSPSIDSEALVSLEGGYALSQVVMSGPKAGTTVSGTLELRASSAAMTVIRGISGSPIEGVTAPYFGWMDLADSSGALIPGDASSREPARPGALLMLRQNGDAMIRFGSDANDRSETPVEGAYLVFRVRDITERSLKGSWSSGMREEVAAGFFCAIRS